MCNLYRIRNSTAEVAHLFGADDVPGVNAGGEVYPRYPGIVVADGRVQAMSWGFRRPMTGARGQAIKAKCVNNARDDKLRTSFWRDSFVKRRLLIPVSAWAEAEGQQGRMTRTWYSLPGEDLIGIAGIWRNDPEWGRRLHHGHG